MPDVTATTHVFPSANDLFGGGAAGDGKNMREGNLAAKWFEKVVERNFVLSGFALPASDPDLTITVPTGKARIAGYFLDVAATNLTLTTSATNHIFLKVLRDGNQNVSSVAFEHNTTGTPPADSVKLGTAVTDADNVTSTTDTRVWTPFRVFTQFQVFTASGTFNMPTDRGEVFAEVYGGGGGGGGGGGSGGPGGAGTAGGTSSFGSLISATGGGGGRGGAAGTSGSGGTGAAHGTSSATINVPGGGSPGGLGGGGGGIQAQGNGDAGGDGGNGGYGADIVSVGPGSATTVTVGAGGANGGGGAAGCGLAGGAGVAGAVGRVVVWY